MKIMLLRDLNSRQGVWSLMAVVPVKELDGGVTNQSGIFRRLMWRESVQVD